ncbi:MAG TPA: universal stress protein [Mucilaginibacter sp.]|nr:universal stress protein [Mucilaginibacter sp.]
MRPLLVATDFSANAKHAAEYGYHLAVQLKTNLILCNAFIVPAEVPQAGLMTWPVDEYQEINKESAEELSMLKDILQKSDQDFGFKPVINYVNETGELTSVVNELVGHEDVQLIIMGTHGNNGLSTFLLGNHSRKMIDEAKCPLLLIPASAPVAPIKMIAFATDFKHIEKDLENIYKLIELARPLNAELLITHINFQNWPDQELRDTLEQLLVDISNKADFPKIYYRIVKSDQPEKGLDWLCDHGQVDMLAMVHRKHNLIEKILTGSHTQKMAAHINIPLLVIPENY